MPPTPPVPAVTITTDPALPVDMSLATGQDTQLELTFSRGLMWSDFGQNARFTYMYNGELHTNVAAIQFADHFRVMGGNSETIIDIPEWAVAGSVENINLIMGHADWKLIAVTYGENYQLKPEDLVGLKIPNNESARESFGHTLANGQEATMIFNGIPMKCMLDRGVLKYYGTHCGPVSSRSTPMYRGDYDDDIVIIDSYTCDLGSAGAYITDVEEWFESRLPSLGISEAQYMGDEDNVLLPVLWTEL